MNKDNDRLARLRKSFEESETELARKKEVSGELAEAERIKLAHSKLPETEKGVLLLFSQVNRDIFQGRGKVSEWRERLVREPEKNGSGDTYLVHESYMSLDDYKFEYRAHFRLGGRDDRKLTNRPMVAYVGGEYIGLEENPEVVVEKVRENLLGEIERRFGSK